jgi:hypothetical protein
MHAHRPMRRTRAKCADKARDWLSAMLGDRWLTHTLKRVPNPRCHSAADSRQPPVSPRSGALSELPRASERQTQASAEGRGGGGGGGGGGRLRRERAAGMGIKDLLRLLRPCTREMHISSFRGKRVAVDAFCWLHRAAYGCALQLAEGRGTDSLVRYCMHRIHMLQHYGVVPVVVFDGAPLPLKAGTNSERRKCVSPHPCSPWSMGPFHSG